MKTLIVDDDLALADILSFTMRRAGYEVILAHDGRTALERWKAENPDLIILDLNLPKLDGLSVCREIRTQADTPIIILSVRGEENDIVEGLTIGADDYVVKPFSPRQVVARSQAVLRRAGSSPASPAEINAGGLTLDPSRGEVQKNGQAAVNLTPLESRMLEILMLNKGQVLHADMLIDHIWGPLGGDKVMLKQIIYRLRRKIEQDPSNPICLVTVPGMGYTFVDDTEPS
ncbi:MAG: response regulator transcription factor [Anaerolineales bacterium]|jgi:DNA-binding response OmpR family regulator